MLKVEFIGGAKTVTGSCFLLTTDTHKILVECGSFQGSKNLEERNYLPFPFIPAEITALILTHAHIDHSGLITKLTKSGFKGKIFATKPTVALSEVMLLDSAHIHEMEVVWKNRKRIRAGKNLIEPLYTAEDAKNSIKFFEPVSYDTFISLTQDIKMCFRDAGHILGSATIEMWINDNNREKKIVFSGDIGNKEQNIIRDPSVILDADILFIESTYGDRLHKNKIETVLEFQNLINHSFNKNGNIIIPAFAVERTQEILYVISDLIKKKQISPVLVFVDSPLAISATEIFKKNIDCFDADTIARVKNNDDPFSFDGLSYIREAEESKKLNEQNGVIIISASGMCEAGRIKHHLKHNLWREESTIIFVGYQANGTLGRALVDGSKLVKIFGEEISVKANIATIGGFSAHADQKELLDWIGNFRSLPAKIFVIHGEEKSSNCLKEKIEYSFKNTNVIIPSCGDIEVL